MEKYQIKPYGDAALIIQFEQKIDPSVLKEVTAVTRSIRNAGITGIRDCIPAYASLTVNYDPLIVSFGDLKQKIMSLGTEDVSAEQEQRRIEIPVLYGTPFPEDLAHVAEHAGMSAEEVIALHTSVEYPVYMIGFLPGFPYLGNLDPRLHTPRRKEPRTEIPAGAVGIGGAQTGVYPVTSPGGWHILGVTPLILYDSDAEDPVLLKSGDLVRFRAVDREEYDRIRETMVCTSR